MSTSTDPTGIPSPPPSLSFASEPLPHPRPHPLRPGSKKEELLRRYVDQRLMNISRRYVKKFTIPDPSEEIQGYATFGELCKDVHVVIDAIWLSGTRSFLFTITV